MHATEVRFQDVCIPAFLVFVHRTVHHVHEANILLRYINNRAMPIVFTRTYISALCTISNRCAFNQSEQSVIAIAHNCKAMIYYL